MWTQQPRRGWYVGSGADEEDELRSRYAIDPGRRWNELAAERERDPVAGWLHTALSPFEPLNTAVQYASGVAQGLVQSGLEQGASAWASLNGQTVPTRLPRELRLMPHSMGDEAERLNPETRDPLDVFNPGTALARYHALTPEPAQIAIEGLGTWGLGAFAKVPQALQRGNAVAQDVMRPGQGAWGALENTQLLAPHGGGDPSLGARALAAAVSTPAKIAAGLAPAAVGGTAMGLTAPDDSSPFDRAGRVAEGVLGGLAIGASVVSAQTYLQRTARLTGRFDDVMLNPKGRPLDPITDAMVKREEDAAYFADRPRPIQAHPNSTNYDPEALVPALYPEGRFRSASANLAWANFRGAVTDRNAIFDDLTNALKIETERQGKPFTDDLNLVNQIKTVHGSASKAAQWIEGEMPVPSSARANGVSVLGAKGVLYEKQIRTTEQLDHFEKMHTVMVAMDRAQQPEQLATGHLGNDLAAQGTALQKLKQVADDRWPGMNMGQNMEDAAYDMTKFSNAILDYYADSGMLPRAAADEAKRSHLVYGYLQSVDDQFDAIWRKPERPTEPLTPTTTKVKEAFSEDDPSKIVHIDTTANIARQVKMIQLADMNKLATKMADAADAFPDTFGTLWRPIEQPASHVEKGWRQVAYFVDGEERRALTIEPMADLLRGINVEAADAVTGAMAKASNVFRKSVTVWNPGFIMANVPRDMYHAMMNTDMPLEVVRQYPGALSSMFTRDLDDWFRFHQDLPIVKNLPQTIWESFRDHALKPWGGADVKSVEQAIEAGMGQTTLTGVVQGAKTPGNLLGIKPAIDSPTHALASVVTTPAHMLEALSDISEMSTRMAVYRAAIKGGDNAFGAAIKGREATVDFSKAGNVTRLANLWLPLLNARVQGELRSFRAIRDNPYGFVAREMALSGVPSVLSYAWNRTMFGDAYEMIPEDERRRNHILVFGTLKDDNDRVKPIYLRMPKDQVASAFTTPLEHILDAVWHTRDHGQPLAPDERTQAPTSWMIMRTLGALLPTDNYPSEMTNGLAWINSALSMNPLWNAGQGIFANQDPFRRQALVPDEQMVLPPEYRYGPQTPTGYKAASHVMTKLFDRMGMDTASLNWLSPTVMQFATRSLGGGLPDYLLQQADVAIPKLQEIGLVPPGAFVPANPEDLRLPPGTPIPVQNQFLAQLEQPDARPAYVRILSRFIGVSARAGGMQERASHLGQREQDRVQATQEFNKAYQNYLVDWRQRVTELDEAPDKTHQAKLDEIQRLGRGRSEARRSLAQEHALAITDQRELREFQSHLPGVGSDWMQQQLPALPPGWSGESIATYLAAPPGVDMANLSITERYKAQRRALNVLSQQLGQPVNVLEMYAGMHKIGAEVPGVAVPNLAIEEAINRYMTPTDARGNELDALRTPAHLMRRAREAVLDDVAAVWRVPADQVRATIDARLNNAMELGADGVSRVRATMLWQRLHDPEKFPTYVNPDGSALGDEAQWEAWDQAIAEARAKYRGRLPLEYQRLEAAKKTGEQRQLQALATADPQLLGPLPGVAIADHERWYGTGRQLTSRQWAEYQSGQLPRYKEGSPTEWGQWDMMQKLYAATPAGPEKARMRNQVRRIRAMQTPGWRDIIQHDQLIREDALYEDMQNAG